MKIATVCSGIGAPEKALKNLGIAFEAMYFCEFDKYAAKSYCAIHDEIDTKNLGDLTKVEIAKLPKDLDLLVGGTPCQDFSLAGKRAGGDAGLGTRSSLMWNFVEIISVTKPKVVLWENVPGCLTQGAMQANFRKFYSRLIELGYTIKAEILNAKNFGIPQNRDRVFVVAMRKDLKNNFEMPDGYDCGVRLKDYLEINVDEKYYLSDAAIERIGKWKSYQNPLDNVLEGKSISPTLTARGAGEEHSGMILLNVTSAFEQNNFVTCAMRGRVLSGQTEQKIEVGGEVANAITTVQKDSLVCEKTAKQELCDYLIKNDLVKDNDVIRHSYNKSRMENLQGGCRTESPNNISPTFDTRCDTLGVVQKMRIRKLTPSECLKLMGFSDADYAVCKAVEMSDSQLYKQAGNSIVVNVLMAIFGQLYGVPWKEKVYGKWWKPPNERYDDLPLMQQMNEIKKGENEKCLIAKSAEKQSKVRLTDLLLKPAKKNTRPSV